MKNWIARSASETRSLWLTAFGVLTLFASGLQAAEGDGRGTGSVGGNTGSPPAPSASGDETIGTLPALNENLPFTRAWDDPHAGFYVEGSFDEVWSAIAGVRGGTSVTIQLIDPSSHRVRFVFHGRVQLLLDRGALQRSSIEIGMAVPQTLGVASTTVGLVGSRSVTSPSAVGYTTLPIRTLDANGTLQSVPLRVSIHAQNGLRTTLQAAAGRDALSLMQTY